MAKVLIPPPLVLRLLSTFIGLQFLDTQLLEVLGPVSLAAIKWLGGAFSPSTYGGSLATNVVASQILHPACDGIRRALGDRIAGQDGSFAKNHHVERAVRYAQIQATRAVLARFSDEAQRKNRIIDIRYAVQLTKWLGTQSAAANSIKLSGKSIDLLKAAIDAPFTNSASPDMDVMQSRAEHAVFLELERAIPNPPESFRHIFFNGRGGEGNWFDAFGTFLARQIKQSSDFRSIFESAHLANLNIMVTRIDEIIEKYEGRWLALERLIDRILPLLERIELQISEIYTIVRTMDSRIATVEQLLAVMVSNNWDTHNLNPVQIRRALTRAVEDQRREREVPEYLQTFAAELANLKLEVSALKAGKNCAPPVLMLAEMAITLGNIPQAYKAVTDARYGHLTANDAASRQRESAKAPDGGIPRYLNEGNASRHGGFWSGDDILFDLLKLKLNTDFDDSWIESATDASRALRASQTDLRKARLVRSESDPRLAADFLGAPAWAEKGEWRANAISTLRRHGLLRINCAALFPAILASILEMSRDLKEFGVDLEIDYHDINSHNQVDKIARTSAQMDFLFAADAAYFTFSDTDFPALRSYRRILACHGEFQWTFVRRGEAAGRPNKLYVFEQSTAELQSRTGILIPKGARRTHFAYGEQIPYMRAELPPGSSILVWEPLAYIFASDPDYHLYSPYPFRNWVSLFSRDEATQDPRVNWAFRDLFVEYWKKSRNRRDELCQRLRSNDEVMRNFSVSCGLQVDNRYSRAKGTNF